MPRIDRTPRVVVQEADHDFVADLGAEEEAAVVPGVERGDARPDAVVRSSTSGRRTRTRCSPSGSSLLTTTPICSPPPRATAPPRAVRDIVGAPRRPLVARAELDVRLPALDQVELVPHARDEDIAVEALADAGQRDHVAGIDGADALAFAAAADLADLSTAATAHRPRLAPRPRRLRRAAARADRARPRRPGRRSTGCPGR